jgi:hypothetical protein
MKKDIVFPDIKVIMKSTVIIACLSLILYVSLASAEETKAGFVKSVSGQVFIGRKQVKIPAKADDKLFENDVIITGPDGKIGIIFQDNSVLGIGSNSQVNISKFAFEPANKKLAFLVQIKKGTLVYLAGLIAKLENKSVKFETPTSVCGVRGTHLAIKVEGGDVKELLKLEEILPSKSDKK